METIYEKYYIPSELAEAMGFPQYFENVWDLFDHYDIDTYNMAVDELLNDIGAQLNTVHPPNPNGGDQLMLRLGPGGVYCVFNTGLLEMVEDCHPRLLNDVREEINERELARLIGSGLAYPTGPGYILTPFTDEQRRRSEIIEKLLIKSGLAIPPRFSEAWIKEWGDTDKKRVEHLIDKLRDLIGDEHEQTEAGPRIAPSTDAC